VDRVIVCDLLCDVIVHASADLRIAARPKGTSGP
jgi:hypothetical protein